jgi:phospholipid-binding lipoprotein MlaA
MDLKMHKFLNINRIVKTILIIAIIITAGCAPKKPADHQDPFEAYNRAMFDFNRTIDKLTIKPVAEVYDAILPNPVKTGVSNFFDNLDETSTVANDLLQLKIGWAIADTWRFIFNSTLGIGGLFDVATHFRLKRREQDLGLTFARWGMKNSSYFVIPILGPSTIRDGIGLLIDYRYLMVYSYVHPWEAELGLSGTNFIRLRVDLLPTDELIERAFDPYILVRNAYLQRRKYLIGYEKIETDEDTYVEKSNSHFNSIVPTEEIKQQENKK